MSLTPRIDELSKNFIINGNFDFWQRGTSFAAANGVVTTDRFRYFRGGSSSVTISRSTDVPTVAESGFKSSYSALASVNTAQGSLGAGDYAVFRHTIEGYDFAKMFGRKCFLSFWVKAFKAGVYSVSFERGDNGISYVSEIEVLASNTWEKKTIIVDFPTDPTGWSFGDLQGVYLFITLAAGSTYLESSLNTWVSGNKLAGPNQVNGVDSTSNTFQLAQVRLSPVGDYQASFDAPFERAGGSIGREFELCQRYFETSYSEGVYPGALTANGVALVMAREVVAGSDFFTVKMFPKRAIPTITYYSSVTGTANRVYISNPAGDNATVTASNVSSKSFNFGTLSNIISSGGTMYAHWTADAEL